MITDLTINSLSCQNEEQLNVGVARRWLSLFRLLMTIGLATAAAGVLLGGPRFWSVLLLVSVYLVGLGLAGAALMTFEYLSGAGWSVALRRVPEAMTALLPVGGAGVLLVLVCQRSLYPWTSGEHHFIGFKAIWLNWPFFLARAVAYLAIWIAFARTMVRNSRQQDATGDLSLRERNVVVSAAFAVLFALTVWLASMDWLMTLEPEWFSTIYGVYHFSGIMASGIAAVVLFGLWLRRLGPWHNVLREEHLQDLGKLLLTFCTFWAYIWFSQYMLIWYANIPEETGYFVRRMSGAWGSLMIVSLLLNWAVPFFVLLPRGNKRNSRIIGQAAIVVLVGRWLDLYLSIVPANPEATPMPDVWMVGLTLGLFGVTGMFFWRAIRQATVVPVGDPYLSESLHYHR